MWDADLKLDGPILLATDGQRDADAAVRAAAQLASATGRAVKVIAVLEPTPPVAGEYGFAMPVEQEWKDRRDPLLQCVRRQITDVLGRDPAWPIEIRRGSPAVTIADWAAKLDAALIVMGLGEHRLIDRALGNETALHTLRGACTPVLAVPPTCAQLPERALVAVDFGDTALAAAQHALAVLPSITSVLLVHVAPQGDMQSPAYAQWRADYQRGIVPAFERFKLQLSAPDAVAVEFEIRGGKTTRQLLAAADEYDAQLLIVGSKGLGLFDRMLVGSTASSVIRTTRKAVFAFPLAALAARAANFAFLEKETIGDT